MNTLHDTIKNIHALSQSYLHLEAKKATIESELSPWVKNLCADVNMPLSNLVHEISQDYTADQTIVLNLLLKATQQLQPQH
ncbi:hypothetical protein [Vibrio cholerae]|uniref:hypothetical protein n=1 Tax=Vibrio cholerae TaxID=666 RepID=UPI00084ADECD|nr:hypothetical protein [Vibrio cholerae]OEC29953.1 hypothetical protein BFX13_18280 [Vibrio cholerae]